MFVKRFASVWLSVLAISALALSPQAQAFENKTDSDENLAYWCEESLLNPMNANIAQLNEMQAQLVTNHNDLVAWIEGFRDAFGGACMDKAKRRKNPEICPQLDLFDGFIDFDDSMDLAALALIVDDRIQRQADFYNRQCLGRLSDAWLKIESKAEEIEALQLDLKLWREGLQNSINRL
ncbi:hypothetical protein [Pseudidiomarina gelatinasegens]|uniref:hypothetical protein n=1 Tax=Pseudidiomarina gelatinasegens TaxID=2487740 RepID=UPI003A9818B1